MNVIEWVAQEDVDLLVQVAEDDDWEAGMCTLWKSSDGVFGWSEVADATTIYTGFATANEAISAASAYAYESAMDASCDGGEE